MWEAPSPPPTQTGPNWQLGQGDASSEQVHRASQSWSQVVGVGGLEGLFPGARRAGLKGNFAPCGELEVAHQGKSGSDRNVFMDGCQ